MSADPCPIRYARDSVRRGHAGQCFGEPIFSWRTHGVLDGRVAKLSRNRSRLNGLRNPLVGHKGSVKFHARFNGVSAHGSMPHLGVNAIYKAARALARLEAFDFGVPAHPVMGKPTLNVGTIEGGSSVNAVADSADIGVDIRTVPGMDHAALLKSLQNLLEEA